MEKPAPNIDSRLRHFAYAAGDLSASGIIVNGRRLKSFVFTTDLAIIRNCDADAVFAVYPFTPQQAISDAIIKYSYVPVFCGVGGRTTRGLRTVQLARDVESQGAMGVVLNAPINNLNLRAVSGVIDIPTVITVTKFGTDFEARIEAGASILNIAAAAQTPELGAGGPQGPAGRAHHRNGRQDRRGVSCAPLRQVQTPSPIRRHRRMSCFRK